MSDEQWIPSSKSELISAIEREWTLLMDVVARLEQAGKLTTLDEGGWSPKDNLAHLAEWMNAMMGIHIDRRPAQEVVGLSDEVIKDIEASNLIVFERNKNRSTEDVLNGLKSTYEKLMTKLNGMSFEDLMKPRRDDDPEKRPLVLWIIGDSSDHIAEHRATIEKLL